MQEVQCIIMLYMSDICTWYIQYKLFLFFTFKFILIIYWAKRLKFNNMRFISFLMIYYFMQVQDIQRSFHAKVWKFSMQE
jgi:hypothetical protein